MIRLVDAEHKGKGLFFDSSLPLHLSSHNSPGKGPLSPQEIVPIISTLY